MKTLMLLFVLLASCSEKQTKFVPLAPAPNPKVEKPTPCADNEVCDSVWYDVRGKNGNGPNANDIAAINKAAGEVITSGKANSYLITARDAGGGFTACIDGQPGAFNVIASAFGVFRTGAQTRFEIFSVKNCP